MGLSQTPMKNIDNKAKLHDVQHVTKCHHQSTRGFIIYKATRFEFEIEGIGSNQEKVENGAVFNQ